MAGMFGHAWVSSYGASPSGVGADTWATALSGITPAQIGRGLRETLALGENFPPSAPKFRALCLGIPTLAQVKSRIKASEGDQFSILMHKHLDVYIFARVDQKTADHMLREAYELAKDHVMRGGELPPLPVAKIAPIDEPQRKPASVDSIRKHCSDIEKILGNVDPSQ